MTLKFKIITDPNAADFERDVNSFMEKNDIMDIKYSTSNTSFSAFIMYCSKEEAKKEAQEKIDSLQKDLNRQIEGLKLTNDMRAAFAKVSYPVK